VAHGRRAALVAAAAVAVAAPFLLLGLGIAPFDDPGEGMHAEIARELRAGGHPFDLRLNGVPYVDKPPLLYALLAGAFAIGGEREAVARLVPAGAALVAIAATAWLGARLLGAPGGLVAGLALLTCVGFYAYGRYVRPETLFVAALALGFALVLSGVMEDRRTLAGAGLAVFGLAGLAKDPLGVLAPPLTVAVALALARRLRPWQAWMSWPGAVGALALGFGWWVLVEARTPGFVWYTVVDNHVMNVARARVFPDEDVPLGAGEFLLVAGLGAVPWIIPAATAVVDLVRRRAWRDPAEVPWTVLALWAGGVLGLTALSPFRLPHYGLPAYAALALLAARGWQGAGRGLLVAHAVLFAVLALACAALAAGDGRLFGEGIMGVTDVATRKAEAAAQSSALPPWSAMRPLIAATAAGWGAGALALAVVAWRGRAMAIAGPAVVLGVMAAVTPAVASGLAQVASARAVRGLAVEVARRAAPGDVLAHEGPIENSGALEWYAGRRAVIVDGRRSVLAFGSTLEGAGEGFWDAARLRTAWTGDRRVWLVSVRAPERSAAPSMPGARLVAAEGGRWLWVNR
jgi:4-amino-4-deoxy-L-arabinose transferase-like glycosyltransferase